MLYLAPLWWALGLNQVIWIPTVVALAAFWIREPRRVIRATPLWMFAVFLGWALLSAVSITEPYRFVSFIKQYSTYGCGWLAAWLVLQTHTFEEEVFETALCLGRVSLISSVFACVGILGYDVSFRAPASFMLPVDLPSGLTNAIFDKSWIQHEASYFRSGWPRPRGLNVYGNHFASMALMGLALTLGMLRSARVRICRVGAAVVVQAVVLVYSLSRGAWLGGLAAYLVLLILRPGLKVRAALLAWAGLVTIAFYWIGASEVLESRLFLKTHSNEGRVELYSKTVQRLLESPISVVLGRGTQETIPGLTVPLGSHSMYLGVLFRHGVVGLGLFLLAMLGLVTRLIACMRFRNNQARDSLSATILFCILAFLIQGLVTELDVVDVFYSQFIWTLIGLGMAASRIATSRKDLGACCV